MSKKALRVHSLYTIETIVYEHTLLISSLISSNRGLKSCIRQSMISENKAYRLLIRDGVNSDADVGR